MLERIRPVSLDNDYRGWKTALWLFGAILIVKGLQSVMIIFNSWSTITQADGIPLDSYPHDAAENIVATFAISSLWRLIVCLLGVVVLIRYRTGVALMFLVWIVSYLGAQLLDQWEPLVRVGTPPGVLVNLALFAVMVAGFIFSVLRRPDRRIA